MPTFAADRDAQSSPEERQRLERDAWSTYQDAVRDLGGREYDEAETLAWDRLQNELSALAG